MRFLICARSFRERARPSGYLKVVIAELMPTFAINLEGSPLTPRLLYRWQVVVFRNWGIVGLITLACQYVRDPERRWGPDAE